MRISLNKIHFPLTTLGYGRRVGIWTQGCSIHCPGCISRDTWERDAGRLIEVEELAASLGPWLAQADGVTISGGEPFDQTGALAELITAIRRRHSGDVLVFSGYPHEKLFAEQRALLDQIDVLISEPFDMAAGQTLVLRGSDNQRIFRLTALARARYPADLDRRPWTDQRHLDMVVDGGVIWMAGIPRPGEMARLRKELARRGFDCQTSDQPNPVVRA